MSRVLLFTGQGGYISCKQAFLFTLVNPFRLGPAKMPVILQMKQCAMRCNSSHGPVFGGGTGVHDLFISDNANTNTISSSHLGKTYQWPQEGQQFLFTGGPKFTVTDYEVFGLYQKWQQTDEWGWGGWGKWRKLEFAQAGLFYSLNWRENRSKNKLVCEHAVVWLGTRELLLSGKLYKTRKTFLVFTSISNMPQEHVPTSLSSFSRATYFLLAGSELDFFVCLSEMLHQKSVKAALQVYLSKCVPGL